MVSIDAPPGRAELRAYLALAASMALVGAYVGVSRVLVAALPVLLLAWLRFLIAAIAMLPWLRRVADEPALTMLEWRLLVVMSLFGNVGFSVCMLYGVAATSALAAGVTMATLPCVVALLAWLLLREPLGPRTATAIAFAVVACGLLASARAAGDGRPSPWWGYALLLGAVFCEAMYVVLGARLTAGLAPRRISAFINLVGLVLMTPAGLWQARDVDFAAVPPSIWLLLVGYALTASTVSVWLWLYGLRRVAAQRAGVFTVFLPCTAALVGILWLGEQPSLLHGVAFAAALVGLLLAVWPATQTPQQPKTTP